MKTLLLSLAIATGLSASAQAQVFRPHVARNVLVGATAGAIIGEHNDHRALEGAAIGAAAGLIWSAATEPYERPRHVPPAPVVSYRSSECEPAYAHPRTTVVVHRPAVSVCRPATRVIYVAPAPVYYVGERHGRHHHHHGRRHVRHCD